jgi:hypothetical protein
MSKFHQPSRLPRRKGSRGRHAGLGRAGITSLAVLGTLTGAGLVAGCGSHHAASPSSAPTVVVTKTVAAASASATASTAAVAPVSASGSASPVPSGPGATTGDGTLLGTYSFQLTNGYGAPLGPAAPTQPQMVSVNSGGAFDLMYNGDIGAGSDEKMINLPNGATPTYSACTTGTAFIEGATPNKGTAFCIIETNGQMAGVVISGLGSSPATASFKVTVWKYVP